MCSFIASIAYENVKISEKDIRAQRTELKLWVRLLKAARCLQASML